MSTGCSPIFATAQIGVWQPLVDILLLLGMAMVLGMVAERLKQSAVVGYLIAGTLVGPGMLGWVESQEQIFQIAELGVAALLFTIGLEFSPRELVRLGRVPLVAGPLQVVLTTLVGMAAGWLIGLAPREALVVGAMTALSSTACVLRVLRDRAELDSQYGRVALGILLVQDAAVVPLVLLVTALAGGGTFAQIAANMSVSVLLAILLVAVFYVLFNAVIPKVLIMPTWRRNRDLPVLLTVCIAGGAAWSAHALQLSPALGAFVAGVLLAVSPFATQIQADIQPLRAVLVTLFFAAIGMFGDAAWFVSHFALVITVLAAIVVGKTLIVALLCWFARLPLQFAIAAGFSLAQIGEFSFVLATIARDSAATDPLVSEDTFRAIVSATILSLLVTPYLVAIGPRFGGWIEARRRKGKVGMGEEAAPSSALPHPPSPDSILVVGFGPAGQRLAEELLGNHLDRLVVVDMNIDNVEVAKRYGIRAYVGDATQTEVMLHAGILRAAVVVIAVPNPPAVRRLIHQVRHLAPEVTIVARSRHHIYRWELLRAGAHAVVDEEDQVGVRLADEVKRALADSGAEDSAKAQTTNDE
jgi:CPA2 family monovalent cation:H+ antiporter-2